MSPVSIGIDVSKRELAVAVLQENGNVILKVFSNTQKGAEELASFLKAQKTAATVPCVLESTGDYHLLSSLILSENGFAVKCINPLLTKQYQRSSIRGAKSDSLDARRLAHMGSVEKLAVFQGEKTLIYRKKLAASCAHLERVIQQLSRHVAQAEELSASIGITIDLVYAREALTALKRQIEALNTELVAQSGERARALSGQLKGLTDRKMAVIDTHLAGRAFGSRDALVAFCGLDVRARRSGQWRGKEHLSKRGNAYLRKTLYHIAWGLSRYHPVYREYYQRLRENKKHYTACIMAVARKFLRFLYAWYWGNLRQVVTLAA